MFLTHPMKKLTKLMACTAGLWLTASASQAGPFTVTFSAQNNGSPLGLSNGTDLPTGSLVRFGYFTIPLNDVLAKFDQISLLNGCFVELAYTQIGMFGGSTSLNNDFSVASRSDGLSTPGAVGVFAHNVTFDAQAMNLIGTTNFWIWAFNTDSINTATEHGMFSADSWTTSSFGTAVFDVGDTSPSDPTDIYQATKGPEQSSLELGTLNKLIPVPEPTSGLLASFGLLFLVSRRRVHR